MFNGSMFDDMAQPNQINDTSAEAESALIDLIRKTPPSVRCQQAIRASSRVAAQCKAAIRRNNPGISEREVGLRFIEINYGQELADEVRAWQTQKDEQQ